ncbi:XrtA system polysaccharide deacetylase [Fundidesulfovibrio terrae]|uniref:XrtA system polysaccharide deacetylase n=1 Tax=Fundidesulfovibrio terrae TaxID=2922866 RepID=UPI001FAFD039|nr:XrtA system polysaccharide deacetylase [Fundidesulfovibrio terrae]
MTHGKAILNALTVDVEDYFHVQAFAGVIPPHTWDSFESRVENNTRRVLDMLAEHDLKATFFVLGWEAERRPGLVRRIAEDGHEVACHGYGHQLIYRIGPDAFREDVGRAKALLEDITGESVTGYRAPSYSITAQSLWALDILIECGFEYDSSIFPVIHDTYGIPDAPRFPHVIERPSGSLLEFPASTFELRAFGMRMRLPVAGGGYLRLFPVRALRGAIRSINRRESRPAVLYFHPWELDTGQPRIKAGLKSRFRHTVNLHKTEAKVRKLISDLPFGPMRQVLKQGRWRV